MGQASVPIVASRKTIERPAGLNCNFVHRQFLIERIFYNDMPVFDFSFPFHSFPVLSVVLSREQAQQMSTHLPFVACWESPKPFYFPSLNIPFERRLLLRFPSLYTMRKNLKMPNIRKRKCCPAKGFATYFLFQYTINEFTKVDMKSEEKYRLRVYAYS